MAYFSNTEEEQQNKPVGAPQSAVARPRNQSGSGGLNVDRLLDANKGVGQQVANRLTSNTNQAVQNASTGVQNASDTFNRAVDAGTNYGDAATPASYNGPKDPSAYYNAAVQQVGKANDQARAVSTLQGRQGQLGGSMLDSLLAGHEGGAQMRQAAAGAKPLAQNLLNNYTLSQSTGATAGQTADIINQSRNDRASRDAAQATVAAQHQADTAKNTNDLAAQMLSHGNYLTGTLAPLGVAGVPGAALTNNDLNMQQWSQLTPEERDTLEASAGDGSWMLPHGDAANITRRVRDAAPQNAVDLLLKQLATVKK